jgi:small-conductance mechanosensitive channel
MLSLWRDTVVVSFQDLWLGLASVLPKILAAFIIFIVGWIIASLIGKLVTKLVRALRVDNALRGTEVERVVNRAGFTLNIARFLGGLVEWFIIVVAFVAAFDILGLFAVNQFLLSVLAYLPNIIVAVVILVLAAIIGEVLQKIVRGSAAAAGMKAATLAGSVTKWAIWIFAILSALLQLQIATPFLETLFTGIVVALALAFGLAFGLGGQQAAAEVIAKVRKEVDTN